VAIVKHCQNLWTPFSSTQIRMMELPGDKTISAISLTAYQHNTDLWQTRTHGLKVIDVLNTYASCEQINPPVHYIVFSMLCQSSTLKLSSAMCESRLDRLHCVNDIAWASPASYRQFPFCRSNQRDLGSPCLSVGDSVHDSTATRTSRTHTLNSKSDCLRETSSFV